ncbi:MAG: hypothetical protein LBI81_01435 [Puniceicoccales bacterium]|jgi:hypothetical protein|nr:hypothetical protein [Puniceicoccales bacterium]
MSDNVNFSNNECCPKFDYVKCLDGNELTNTTKAEGSPVLVQTENNQSDGLKKAKLEDSPKLTATNEVPNFTEPKCKAPEVTLQNRSVEMDVASDSEEVEVDETSDTDESDSEAYLTDETEVDAEDEARSDGEVESDDKGKIADGIKTPDEKPEETKKSEK